MSTTIADRGRPARKQVLLFSVAAQVGLVLFLWLAAPLRKSIMQFDPSAMEQQAAEVQKRNRERVEKERERRENVAIKDKDAEKLRKKARAKEERKAVEKMREMREAREQVKAARRQSLEKLQQRSFDGINARKIDELLIIAAQIADTSYHLGVRSKRPQAQTTRKACLALEAATEQFLEVADWNQSEALGNKAKALQTYLQKTLAKIAEEVTDPEDASKQYTHLLFFGPGMVSKIDVYLAKLDELITDPETLDALNDLGDRMLDEPLPEDADLADLDLAQLVEASRRLEESIAEDFAEMRAAEMAQIENSTFQEALEKIAGAMQSASTQASASPEGASAERTAGGKDSPSGESSQGTETAGSSTEAQSAGAASGSSASGKAPTTVGDLQAYRASVASLGKQATGHWTKAVNMAAQAGAMRGRNQAGRSAQALKQSTGKSGQAGTGRGAPGGGGDGGSKSSDRSNASSGSSFRSNTSARGAGARGLRTNIPAEMIKAKALPGRRFSKQSDRQGWLFLDTWYIIGPWENNGQLAYDVTHPPEVAIDLDAAYADGKKVSGQSDARHPLKWTFVQSDIMRITPPNEQARSTYYAYTDVYFDEPTRMLVAIATDDAARMWVNDKLVWEDQGLSGWSLDEGFRVIDFKQGFNKFLVRIENSPVLCEFSVLLCPPDQVKK